MKNERFHHDFKFGVVYEEELKKILSGRTVEVKTERAGPDDWHRKWPGTGNICVEYESRGKPSGIAVTKADFWAHVLTYEGVIYGVLLLPMATAKAIARKYYHAGKTKPGGDDLTSMNVLVPLKEICPELIRMAKPVKF